MNLLYKLCMPNQRYMTARKFLLDELTLRQKKNPAYSQRAFARDLDIQPSRLSEIMGGKVGISYVNATKIATKLNLSSEESNIFLDLVSSEFGRSSAIRMAAASRLKSFRQGGYRVRTDEAHLISDWYYFALLGLIELEDFECNTMCHLGQDTVLSSGQGFYQGLFQIEIGFTHGPFT